MILILQLNDRVTCSCTNKSPGHLRNTPNTILDNAIIITYSGVFEMTLALFFIKNGIITNDNGKMINHYGEKDYSYRYNDS